MSIPVIYQPLPSESKLACALSSDRKLSHLFTVSYPSGRGPLHIFSSRQIAEQFNIEKEADSAFFDSDRDIVTSINRLIVLVKEVLLIFPDLIERRETADCVIEIEDAIGEFIDSRSLEISKAALTDLLYGEFFLTSDDITGACGGPLKVVSTEGLSRAFNVFTLLEQQSFKIDISMIWDEYIMIKYLYDIALQRKDIIVAGY